MHLNLESDDGEAKQQTHMIDLRKIAIKDYPQLKTISWQLRDEAILNALEAKGIYERNEKYISFENLQPDELELIRQLGVEFKRHH
jgi:hypothetical protein